MAGKMVQMVKTLITKCADLSTRVHIMEGDNRLQQVVLTHMCTVNMYTQT